MNREELIKGMDEKRVLFGMFFALGNRLQMVGDSFYEEITCKQFFLLICLSLFQETPPTLNQLSEVMASSHQNVKQMVNKLEEKGFVKVVYDPNDKRKQRVQQTSKLAEFADKYGAQEIQFMSMLYKGLSKEDITLTLKTIQGIENNLMEIMEGLS